MPSNKPPAQKITGIRAPIPPGYLLGRVSKGVGDVELISMQKAQSAGLIPSVLPGPPTGAAGGDLSGFYPNPTVARIQSIPVQAGTPSNLAVLLYHTAGATWLPVVLATVAYTGNYSDLSGLPAIHNVIAGGTTGQVLTKNSNADYDLIWTTPSGGGGGGAASIQDDGTNLYVALSDADGQLVLDGSGDPIFSLEVLPPASLPLASSSAFGAVKVDNFTLQAAAGVIGTLFEGFLVQLGTSQAVTNITYTKVIFDTFITNTLGVQYSVSTGLFTPTKAGKYLIFSSLLGTVAGGVPTQMNNAISKNGTFTAGAGVLQGLGTAGPFNAASTITSSGFALAIASMNGTTDTIEIDMFLNQGTGATPQALGFNASSFGAIYLGA